MSEEKNIPPEEIPEQPVNKPSDETTSSDESVTEADQLITHHSELITNDMEVHQHTHAAHQKKTWSAYFWEFLMLFLAVFCGFLAEYQLEHVIEKHRANEFAFSLHQDLKNDTTHFLKVNIALDTCIVKIDTLISILNNNELTEKNIEDINRLSIYAFIFPANRPKESTLQQLVNSGSLRYFKNKALVDSITLYNSNIQFLKAFNLAVSNFNTEFRIRQSEVTQLNPLINQLFRSNNSDGYLYTGKGFEFSNPPLLTKDPAKLKEYANWCALKKFYMMNTVRTLKDLLTKMDPILKIIDKEYSFE
ncbi:MAG: hypothetical protein ABIW38_01085 [Ferruginibacter sp.]